VTECPECNRTLDLVTGPGRMKKYRKELFELPADMPIRTCPGCGAEWMLSSEVSHLSRFLEQAYDERHRGPG
jgi:hypothetical protein